MPESYDNFMIGTLEDLIKGFAIAIRDEQTTLDAVRNFLLECSKGDEAATQHVIEKINVQLECFKFIGLSAKTALSA